AAPLASGGMLVSTVLTYGGLVAVIVVVIVVLAMLGAPEIDITQLPTRQYPHWLVSIFVAVAAMGNAIAGQTRWRLILPTALVSAIGYVVYVSAIEVGFGPSIAPAAAAVV